MFYFLYTQILLRSGYLKSQIESGLQSVRAAYLVRCKEVRGKVEKKMVSKTFFTRTIYTNAFFYVLDKRQGNMICA